MVSYNVNSNILLIEDNNLDSTLMKEALSESDPSFKIDVISEGAEALRFLKKEGEYSEASTPDLILLDLKLPNVDGYDILSFIKSNDKTRRIPVVVLTMSELSSDIKKSYSNHANCYVTKPVDFDEFIKTLKVVKKFWLNIVKLPPKLEYE